MGDLVSWVNEAIARQGAWAALVFALVAFAESTAFVGAIVPATPILFMVGALIGTGRLDPWQIVPAGMVGAILGYGLSYEAGRLASRRLTSHRWLRGHRRGVARARLFFRRYGAPSLIFGRYVLGPFQSLLPFVAGTVRMDWRRFWLVNLVSGLLWVPLCLSAGYLAVRGAGALGVGREWQDGATLLMTAISAGAALICLLFVFARWLRPAN